VLITLSAVTPAASVFVIAPEAISALGGASLIAFAGGALLCLAGAMCYAELASALPLAGGEFSYAARILGAGAGTAVLGSAVVSVVLIIASLANGAGDLVSTSTGAAPPRVVALVVIVVGTLIASLRVTIGARLTGAFLGLELATLVAVSLLGLLHVSRPLQEAVATGPAGSDTGTALAVAVVAQLPTAIFAYNGYASGVFLTEDLRQASSTVATMIYTSLLVVVLVELGPVTALLLGAPSIDAMMAAPSPIAYFVATRGGSTAVAWLVPAIALAIANAVIAIILQASRLVFRAARDGAITRGSNGPLGRLDPRTGTPARATGLIGLLSAVALVLVPPGALLTLTASTLLVPGAAVAASALVGRRRGITGVLGYRMPWWPLPALVTLCSVAGIAVVQWRADEARILAPVAVFAAAYVAGIARQRRHDGS
jgi:amino acid transporter